MNRRTRDDKIEVLRMGYNVARKPIGTVPNALLTSALGRELYPLILSTLSIYGGQVKRERDRGHSTANVYIHTKIPYHHSRLIWVDNGLIT